MFEIGFSELVMIMVVGLVVLGPKRLPVAVKTVASWMRAIRSLATTVQNELSQELKLQELQDSLNKVEKNALQNLTPELKASMDELRAAAQAMQKSYTEDDKPADAAAKPSDEKPPVEDKPTQASTELDSQHSKVDAVPDKTASAAPKAESSLLAESVAKATEARVTDANKQAAQVKSSSDKA